MSEPSPRPGIDQRLEIVGRAEQGENDASIARAMHLSPWTVRKWRRLGIKKGRRALAPRMGRPPTGALGHVAPSVRDQIRQLRTDHPGWGPKTLHLEVTKRMLPGQSPPSSSRIAAFLKAEGRTRPYERRSPLPQPGPSGPAGPHVQWQMDAQGALRLTTLGRVALINVVDCFSRVKPVSWPCLNTATPATADYQLALRVSFSCFGLPRRISVDHDGVFYDTTCASPFPTQLHLWAIAIGIEIDFTRCRRPTDHALVERMHQTVMHQAIDGQDPATVEDLYTHLKERLTFLNEVYPSRALDGQAPLVACPQAQHSGRPYRPEWEADLLDLERVTAYLARGKWFRRVYSNGRFSLGAYSYGLGKPWANSKVEIAFRPQTRELVCVSEDGERNATLPIKGITKEALMGEISPSIGLLSYQPMLPLDTAAWRQCVVSTLLTGTTL